MSWGAARFDGAARAAMNSRNPRRRRRVLHSFDKFLPENQKSC
jgi:hypothetical protein